MHEFRESTPELALLFAGVGVSNLDSSYFSGLWWQLINKWYCGLLQLTIIGYMNVTMDVIILIMCSLLVSCLNKTFSALGLRCGLHVCFWITVSESS